MNKIISLKKNLTDCKLLNSSLSEERKSKKSLEQHEVPWKKWIFISRL